MENAAAFPTIQPLDYDYEKQDTTACPIWLEKNVSTNLDKITYMRVGGHYKIPAERFHQWLDSQFAHVQDAPNRAIIQV